MTSVRTLIDTAVLSAQWLRLERPGAGISSGTRPGRHLALLASALPPSSNVGVLRPLSFMRYACSVGWRIDAFCSDPPITQRQHGDELLARVPREATLHVVPTSVREPSYRFFPRVDGAFANALAYARYVNTLLANDPPHVVLASGPRFFTFVAALFAARRFGAPLVLDYRDEWTECPFDFVQKDGSDRRWERRCLRHASAVFFTTESHRRHQLATFPELAPQKAFVVSNGWEPEEFVQPAGESRGERPAHDTLRISHVGSLAGQTPPHDFLASLERLLTDEPEWARRVRVQFIGRRGPGAAEAIRAFRFPAVLEVIDHIGKRDAVRRMQESDVLLVIARQGLERYLPAKIFDYLGARRPVLVYGLRGESSELVEQLGAGVFCPAGSSAALRDALVRLQTLDMPSHDAPVNDWLSEHRREVLAARAFGIIEPLVAPVT